MSYNIRCVNHGKINSMKSEIANLRTAIGNNILNRARIKMLIQFIIWLICTERLFNCKRFIEVLSKLVKPFIKIVNR